MAYSTSYISQVTLSSGTYDIKDAWAREKLAGLSGAMHFVGISTTDPTLPAGPTIEGHTGDYKAGDVCVWTPEGKAECEYVYTGTSWQEFGSTGSLKALAFKDSVSGTVSLSGTCTPGAFTGTQVTNTHSVTKSDVSVSGSYDKATSATTKYTPTGSVSAPTITLSSTENGASKLKTAGSVSAGSAASIDEDFFSPGTYPTLVANSGKATVVNVTAGSDASLSAGAQASFTQGSKASFTQGAKASFSQGTKADWSASVSGETLSFSFTPNGNDSFTANGDDTFTANGDDTFVANTLQTLSGGKATVVNVTAGSDASLTAGTAPSVDLTKFNGGSATQVTLPTFDAVALVTSASASEPTFTGEEATIAPTISHTPTAITSTGSAAITISDHVFTPAGSVADGSAAVSGTATLS